ncbi:hypothetical protein GLYMA_11G117000v4 [Glycine max]|uniref:Reverse transcriptase zinc-binding domain-containing protein n=2 Tax=Glycine subgen. Soja TaxID=1462606 RepID=A0A0R0HFT6_SOYBN|nr:hypothetical protein JHK87_030633 [Glycine soja]KAG4988384.1 hypothetical protein JHK85_031367 [Glycine max]KAG5145405.1 hypothetical protein JHK84_030948 [Glycine max]KAH1158708.1 hypothetical protein GYH30_030763 [Glycine max]KRH29446.1 hypothetical protein GLYMA_11G117000v4 [Glycine max]
MINSFWWGSNRSSGKWINWLGWDRLAVQKENGNLFLIKMLWCLESSKPNIYPKGVFLDANLGHNPSLVWHSIHASQVLNIFV